MGYAINLTDDEIQLLGGIELDTDKLRFDREAYKRQGPLVLRLWNSLMENDAIPEHRLRYWSDPEYQLGRVQASHKEIFERNGTTGEAIYAHPNFLGYLRYFLFGAQLPRDAISEFEGIVGNPEWVTSGDATKISKGSRDLVRRYRLQGQEEEFYRLALDVGLDQYFAKVVRDAVKQVR